MNHLTTFFLCTIVGLCFACESQKTPAQEIQTAPDSSPAVIPESPPAAEQTAPQPPPATPIEKAREPSVDAVTDAVADSGPQQDTSVSETTGSISLDAVTIARGVDRRQPVDPGTRFTIADGTRIYAVLDVKNPEETEDTVSVSFRRPDSTRETGLVTVKVGPHKKWRTWAFTRHANTPGQWTAVIRNSANDIIGEYPFEMVR